MHDIRVRMTRCPGLTGAGSAADPEPARRASLEPGEFAARFEQVAGTLWYVAAAVLGDRNDADDVLQEAAMIALDKLDRFDPSTDLTAWVSQIVRNVARNHARRRRRQATLIAHADASAVSDPVRPQTDFDAELHNALNELNETARTCLLLRTLRGMSYRQIAQVLGIPEGTAMSHVFRARAGLRQRLARHPDAPQVKGATRG